MSTTPVFDALAAEYPGIHRASNIFPQPAPEPHISFIKERGAWELFTPSQFWTLVNGLKP